MKKTSLSLPILWTVVAVLFLALTCSKIITMAGLDMNIILHGVAAVFFTVFAVINWIKFIKEKKEN